MLVPRPAPQGIFVLERTAGLGTRRWGLSGAPTQILSREETGSRPYSWGPGRGNLEVGIFVPPQGAGALGRRYRHKQIWSCYLLKQSRGGSWVPIPRAGVCQEVPVTGTPEGRRQAKCCVKVGVTSFSVLWDDRDRCELRVPKGCLGCRELR